MDSSVSVHIGQRGEGKSSKLNNAQEGLRLLLSRTADGGVSVPETAGYP